MHGVARRVGYGAWGRRTDSHGHVGGARRRERQQKQTSAYTAWDVLVLVWEWSCGAHTPLGDMVSHLSEAANVRDFLSSLAVILVAFAICAGSGYFLSNALMIHRPGTLLIVPGH